MTGRVRRHIREHDIGWATEPFCQDRRRFGDEKIELAEIDAGNRFDWQKIDAEDFARIFCCADLGRRDLRPPARRRAEIDNLLPTLEDMIPGIDFEQLVGRAGSVAFCLGPRDIGIVELALEPER